MGGVSAANSSLWADYLCRGRHCCDSQSACQSQTRFSPFYFLVGALIGAFITLITGTIMVVNKDRKSLIQRLDLV